MEFKRLRVPDADVKLDLEEIAVTQTRTFQRLFWIRQLGLAYLVYPGATHTRGTHSIQCVDEASKILRALGVEPQSEEAKNIRMAALLHDIGHVPFSHTLEDEHVILEKHDKVRYRKALDLLQPELGSKAAARVEAATPILRALAGDVGFPTDWKSDIIGNTVCADLLAYIGVDARWTGIEKRPGSYRIYDYFRRGKDAAGVEHLCILLTKGGLRVDIVSAIMDLLDMRYALTERVVYHHAKCVASGMLARAVRLATPLPEEELLQMGDERFIDWLAKAPATGSSPESAGASHLANGLFARRLYKRVFKLTGDQCDRWDRTHNPTANQEESAFCSEWRDGAKVERALRSVEEQNSLPVGSLALWCPKRESGMKLAETRVVWDTANGTHDAIELRSREVSSAFPQVGQRVKVIEDQYRDLWSFWVALDRRFLDQAGAIQLGLNTVVGIDCDPVFVKTYLQTDKELSPSLVRVEKIGKEFEGLMPTVDRSLAQQAARGGVDALGSAGLDKGMILKTIETVAGDSVTSDKELKDKKGQKRLDSSQ